VLTTVDPYYGLAAFAVGALPAYLFARSVQ